jgi:hypothetical protein
MPLIYKYGSDLGFRDLGALLVTSKDRRGSSNGRAGASARNPNGSWVFEFSVDGYRGG